MTYFDSKDTILVDLSTGEGTSGIELTYIKYHNLQFWTRNAR